MSNNINKTIREIIKYPDDKYEIYDKYIPEHLKDYFKKPIGLYDPLGENINPLTERPYENVYKDAKPIPYDDSTGPLVDVVVPKTYINWAVIWSRLALYKVTGEIIKSIRENNITVIKAGTGVGKSFLAGRLCSQAFNFQKKVIMTLPKKLLARETAETTAITCDVVLGEEVGYYFKGNYKINENGKTSKIIFTTTGSIIRKLTGDDPYLSDYDCIVIDEAHERSVQTDELILFLKKMLPKRPDLKVVFISATLDLETFRKYFKEYTFNVVDLGEGTTKKIETFWQPKPLDWQKVAVEKIMNILKSGQKGDIIVFIRSGADGGKMRQMIEQQLKTVDDNPFITVLDASVTKAEQDYATKEFEYLTHPTANPDRPFTRKIVFATNVAESSLTIKGAVFVIDCGLALEDEYFPMKNANALLEKFVSKSAVKQRRGRVGRTKDGVCYHLYSEKEYEKFIDYPIPSILKSNLTMDILDIMKIEYIKNIGDMKKLLGEMMTPPEPKFIDSALHILYSMEAITSKDDKGTLTDLGKAMTTFSGIPIYFAKAIIASYYYHCKHEVIPIIIMVEALKGRIETLYSSYKPPRKLNEKEFKKEEEKFIKLQHRFDSKLGDFITLHNIYNEFKKFVKTLDDLRIENEIITVNNKNQQLGGANANNTNTTNTTNTTKNINKTNNLTKLTTKKKMKLAEKWCKENGFRANIFINFRDERNWNRLPIEARKIDATLMDIVRPINKISNVIDPESKINLDDDDIDKNIDAEIKEEKIRNKSIYKNSKLKSSMKKGGSSNIKKSTIKSTNKSTNKSNTITIKNIKNYFKDVKYYSNKEDNILAALANGLYINMAKSFNNKYMTCFPLEKTMCKPDPKTTLSLKVHPAFLFYNELFMMREGQSELKLNFITKMPSDVLAIVKEKYEKYIPDCYKTTPSSTLGLNKFRNKVSKKNLSSKYKHQHKHQHQHQHKHQHKKH